MTDSAKPLALKYRPAKFSQLVGQRIHAAVLQRMVDEGKVPPALLFSGPSGVGKTSAARVLAAEVGSTDVIEVDAASNGGVDQIRKLLEVSRYSTGGAPRLLILDEAHSITKQGFEALLKALEEPSGTIYVLVTTDPYKIPGTILSRLIEFQFRSVSDAEILDRLMVIATTENIQISNQLLNHIVRKSSGNVRTALMSMDQAWRAGVTSLEDYQALTGDHDMAPALLLACTTGDHAKVFSELDSQLFKIGSPSQVVTEMINVLRDLLILKAGGTLAATGEDLEARMELSRILESERVLAALKLLWELRTRFRLDDPRSSLELSLVFITEAFTKGRDLPAPKPVASTVSAPPPRRMSLSDLQRHHPVS